MLAIDIVTIFPHMFDSVFEESIVKRGLKKELFSIHLSDLRKWSPDQKHLKVDDTPYGGGPGMVMMIEPIAAALDELRTNDSYVVLLSAHGNKFNQKKAMDFSKKEHIIFICGHYEGVDQRVADHLVDEEVSIGDFVLTGGEIPTMAIVDATVRLIPGVLGNAASLLEESFSLEGGEYPQYTKPAVFKNLAVPDILISGNHGLIKKWRETMIKRRDVK